MWQFGTLDSREKTIAILGNRWWPLAARQEGEKASRTFLRNVEKKRIERPNAAGVSARSRNCAPFRKGCVINDHMTSGKQQMSTPPFRPGIF